MTSNDTITNGKALPINGHKQYLRAEATQELLSRKEGFLTRWALLVFLGILLFLLTGTWFIRYSDVIAANASLTAENAPKEIVTRIDGKFVRIFVSNGSQVREGEMIAWIESTASHKEVLELLSRLERASLLLSGNETEKVSSLFGGPFYNLGEMQSAYQQFVVAWQQFNDYLVNGYVFKRKQMLFDDLSILREMHASLEDEKILMKEDLELSRQAFIANDTLFKDKVISTQDMREQRSKLVGKELTLPQLESALLTNEDGQIAKKKEIDELEHNIGQQKIIFWQSLQTLQSITEDWIKRYVVKAPVNGKVVFLIPVQENQFIQAGKTIGYVDPPDSRYFAQITLPQFNFGKARVGQTVQLRFDAYPYEEFGSVEGKLSYISKVPSDSGFLANIEMPNGLRTNHGKEIQYRSGLTSKALVITRDTRLLERFYYTLIKNVSDR
jgi:multidrug resistance efflux pump